MMKKKSKCWKVYHVKECDLKNYKGISLTKTRPILVVSDAENLYDKCLVAELGSHKNNNAHILWYSYFSKKYKCEKESWIKPDCLHIINRWYLTRQKQSHSAHIISLGIKLQIHKYLHSIINEK